MAVSERVKDPDAVAGASLGVRGNARHANSREIGGVVTAEFVQRAATTGIQRRPQQAHGSRMLSAPHAAPMHVSAKDAPRSPAARRRAMSRA